MVDLVVPHGCVNHIIISGMHGIVHIFRMQETRSQRMPH